DLRGALNVFAVEGDVPGRYALGYAGSPDGLRGRRRPGGGEDPAIPPLRQVLDIPGLSRRERLREGGSRCEQREQHEAETDPGCAGDARALTDTTLRRNSRHRGSNGPDSGLDTGCGARYFRNQSAASVDPTSKPVYEYAWKCVSSG